MRLLRTPRIAFELLFSVALCIVIPGISFASTGLTIQPVKISETLKPGETAQGTILLTNASDDTVTVDVKVEDFTPTAGAETIQFVGRAPGVTTVRDWISIGGSSSFIFQKGESKEIPYTIKAPANAEPGGHFGVVFFKATKNNGADQLKVGTQVGMLVLVAIPGSHLQKGKIIDFTTKSFIQYGPVSFSLKFENTGTVHFEPKGQIIVTNMFGSEVTRVPIEGQVVLPTSIKELHFNWDAPGLLLGEYKAAATIVDGDGNVLTTESVRFYAFPIWYGVSFILVFLFIFFLLRFLKKRVKISVSVT